MRLLILFICTLASGSTYAKGMFRTAGTYQSSSRGSSATNRLVLDVNPGYLTEKGWAFGGMYEQDSVKTAGSALTTTSMGVSAGAFARKEFGFYGLATYYFSSKRSDDWSGMGYQVDGGYRFEVRRISYAMQVSYKQFKYDKSPGGSAAGFKVGHVDPTFSVWFEF